RISEELGTVAEQTARRNAIAQPNETLSGVFHLQHLTTPRSELLDHRAEKFLWHVDHQLLVRLEALAIRAFARDHSRPRHMKLIPFSPHRLHQNTQMQLAAAGDRPRIRPFGVLDTQGNVTLELSNDPRP